MSEVVVLTLRTAPTRALELAGVTPDRLTQLPQREIAALPVRHAGRAAALGDFFTVKGERAARVRLEGDLQLAEGMGAGMTGGELVVEGHAGPDAGRWTKRGSIVACGPVARPATFRYACTYRPPHVRLLLLYLRERRGLEVADRWITGCYDRYSGDLAELGKGEMLQWAGE